MTCSLCDTANPRMQGPAESTTCQSHRIHLRKMKPNWEWVTRTTFIGGSPCSPRGFRKGIIKPGCNNGPRRRTPTHHLIVPMPPNITSTPRCGFCFNTCHFLKCTLNHWGWGSTPFEAAASRPLETIAAVASRLRIAGGRAFGGKHAAKHSETSQRTTVSKADVAFRSEP